MNEFKRIFNKNFYQILGAIALLEVVSYFGYIFPIMGEVFFYLLAAAALIFSLKNIKYGLYLAFAELFIGSKGYLFSAAINGTEISIRIAIWLIIISVWTVFFFNSIFKKDPAQKSIFLKLETYKKYYLPYFFILFFFIVVGLINGLIRNDFADVFLDFNAYLYFALIFPLCETIFNPCYPETSPVIKAGRSLPCRQAGIYEDNFSNNELPIPFIRIFSASISWLFIKTFALLFVFSHSFPYSFIRQTYRWVRETGVGEITMMPSGFVRIFFQSHIFILFAFFAILFLAVKFSDNIKNKKFLAFLITGQAAMVSLIMISYSRSFWVGLAVGFLFFILIAFKRFGWKKILTGLILTLISAILAAGAIAATVKFPIPNPGVDFDITQALADRAKKINNEAAASSRYALLPELWTVVKSNPILGGGFGRTVTYRTSDPRALENNPEGLYTTYAFEWGWLDIWLKLGLLGALFYSFFFLILIKNIFKKNRLLTDILAVSLLIVAVVNFFTPYANHPLGIGFFLLSAAAISFLKKS